VPIVSAQIVVEQNRKGKRLMTRTVILCSAVCLLLGLALLRTSVLLASSAQTTPAPRSSAATQGFSTVFDIVGISGGDKLGMVLENAGDVNGDGIADLAAGVPHHDGDAGRDTGLVLVYSGADRSILYDIEGNQAGARVGESLCRADDTDGDGAPELCVGAPGADSTLHTDCGRVFVLSGRTGAVRAIIDGADDGESFGFALARAGDVNADGLTEILVGAPLADGSTTDNGRVALITLGGDLLGQAEGEEAGDNFGYDLCTISDTGSIKPRFWIVGAPFHNPNGLYDAGRIYVFYADPVKLITVLDGVNIWSRFGSVLASGGDVDGDGREDLLAGTPRESGAAGSKAGRLRVISGRTGQILHSLEGANEKDEFGHAAIFVGDVGGDGCDEFLVGTPFYDLSTGFGSGNGRVDLYDGNTGTHLVELLGIGEGETYGWALGAMGDIDGNGIVDFAAGAPSYDEYLGNSDIGIIRLCAGSDGATIDEIKGRKGGDQFGFSAAGGSDLDGDGIDDIAVGAIGHGQSGQNSLGAVHLFSADGSLLTVIAGDEEEAMYGAAIVGLGDINGDGLGDLAVGAPYADIAGSAKQGQVFFYSGTSETPFRIITGDSDGEQFGSALARIPDMNGDGRAEVLIGAPVHSSKRGQARLFSGATGALLDSHSGSHSGEKFGAAVASAGDVNGDGTVDLLIGAPGYTSGGLSNRGRIEIRSGLDGSLLEERIGENESDAFGCSVAGLGDLNGDGDLEYMVGAFHYSSIPNALNGAAYVFSYNHATPLYFFEGESYRAQFGYALAAPGDMNGDGIGDIAVSGFRNNAPDGLGDSGRVSVYSGADGNRLAWMDGESGGDQIGSSIAGVGDIDGDSRNEIVTGAHLVDVDSTGFNTGKAYVLKVDP